MWVEHQVVVRRLAEKIPGLSAVSENLSALTPDTFELSRGDVLDLFPDEIPEHKTALSWSHLNELSGPDSFHYAVSVTSGVVSKKLGVCPARSKVFVSVQNAHGVNRYVLTPEAYPEHPDAVPFRQLPYLDREALRIILRHFILSNPNFARIPPVQILNETQAHSRADVLAPHFSAGVARVKEWLKASLVT